MFVIQNILKILRKPYLAIVFSLLILIFCVIPSEKVPLSEDLNDKLAHFVAFTGISFLWLWVKPKYLFVLMCMASFGVFIELIQGSLPASFHRSYDLMDVLADCIGSVLGGLLFWLSEKVIKSVL